MPQFIARMTLHLPAVNAISEVCMFLKKGFDTNIIMESQHKVDIPIMRLMAWHIFEQIRGYIRQQRKDARNAGGNQKNTQSI